MQIEEQKINLLTPNKISIPVRPEIKSSSISRNLKLIIIWYVISFLGQILVIDLIWKYINYLPPSECFDINNNVVKCNLLDNCEDYFFDHFNEHNIYLSWVSEYKLICKRFQVFNLFEGLIASGYVCGAMYAAIISNNISRRQMIVVSTIFVCLFQIYMFFTPFGVNQTLITQYVMSIFTSLLAVSSQIYIIHAIANYNKKYMLHSIILSQMLGGVCTIVIGIFQTFLEPWRLILFLSFVCLFISLILSYFIPSSPSANIYNHQTKTEELKQHIKEMLQSSTEKKEKSFERTMSFGNETAKSLIKDLKHANKIWKPIFKNEDLRAPLISLGIIAIGIIGLYSHINDEEILDSLKLNYTIGLSEVVGNIIILIIWPNNLKKIMQIDILILSLLSLFFGLLEIIFQPLSFNKLFISIGVGLYWIPLAILESYSLFILYKIFPELLLSISYGLVLTVGSFGYLFDLFLGDFSLLFFSLIFLSDFLFFHLFVREKDCMVNKKD